jgi:hypothetical protein
MTQKTVAAGTGSLRFKLPVFAMSCEEAYEEMMKTVPPLLNASTLEQAQRKPGEDVTIFMQGLAAKFFEIRGDNIGGTAGSLFFLGFQAKSYWTPWFRWCRDCDPPIKYKLSEDRWYKVFGNMVQARNARKQKREPEAAVPRKVACTAAAATEEDPADVESGIDFDSRFKELMEANQKLERKVARLETSQDNANRATHNQAIRRDNAMEHRISRLEASWGKKKLTASTKELPVARKKAVKAIRAPVVKVTACLLLPVTASNWQF